MAHGYDEQAAAEYWGDDVDDCYQCGGEGEIEVDCGEDSCCCAEPHAVIPCPMCSPARESDGDPR